MSKIYSVKNRSASIIAYSIPDEHIRKQFAPGETKKISHEELEKLTYQPGGEALIRNYLQIQDADAAIEFNNGLPVEPEYSLNEAGVKELLTKGSLDEFLDALDFAPAGVIDLIKSLSVNLPLTDVSKIEALKAKTGYDCAAAVRHLQEEKISEKEEVQSSNVYNNGGKRRTETAQATPGRRTAGKYNIVSMENNN